MIPMVDQGQAGQSEASVVLADEGDDPLLPTVHWHNWPASVRDFKQITSHTYCVTALTLQFSSFCIQFQVNCRSGVR